MELELFEIYVSYRDEKGQEVIGPVRGFCLHTADDARRDLKETCDGIHFDIAHLADKSKKQLAAKWHYRQCALMSHRSFSIDRLPKNVNWFKWLIFHNFDYFVADRANRTDIKNKLEACLDFQGDE